MFPGPSVPFIPYPFMYLKNISTLHSSGNDPMDVDVGSNDQNVSAERSLHNLQILTFSIVLFTPDPLLPLFLQNLQN
jgi:hypothetical protein